MLVRIWVLLLILVLFLGFALRDPILPTMATVLLVVLAAALWWRNRALEGVVYRRRFHFRRAFPGEQVPLRIEVENRKLLPLSWLRVRDPWPEAVGPSDESLLTPTHEAGMGLLVNAFSLWWRGRGRRSYDLRFRERGIYAVGPARLESGDLFGVFSNERESGGMEYVTVFPRLLPPTELDLPPEHPYGDRKSRRRMYEDLTRPIGVRDYHPEDGFRRVHWPATARTGDLKVKIFQPVSAPVMMVCLNAATYARYWEGYHPAMLEYLVRATASLLYRGLENGYQVGMVSNGGVSGTGQPFRFPPARSTEQLARLLQALAGIVPLITVPFDRFLLRELPRVPYGSTLVVVTAVVTPELEEALVRIIRHGRRAVLVSMAKEPPPDIFGVRRVHLPFSEELVED